MIDPNDLVLQSVRHAIDEGADVAGVLAAARTVRPELGTEEVLSVADALADEGLVRRRLTPPTVAVGRREMLRDLFVGTAAAASAVMAVSLPRRAMADEGVCDDTSVDFRALEENEKLAERDALFLRSREEWAKSGGRRMGSEDREKQVAGKVRPTQEEHIKAVRGKESARKKVASSYVATGPAPSWIEVNGLDLIPLEVEQSSIKVSGEGSCEVSMDFRIDALSGGSIKDGVAKLERLAPMKAGGESPFLEVTWGLDGEYGFEGFLQSTAVAYDAFTPKGEPVRALVRATFLLA